MSARELVLDTSDGGITTLSFTESTLTIRSDLRLHRLVSSKSAPFLFSSSASVSPVEIPTNSVIAATLSGSTIEVSYVTRNKKQRLHMKHVRGNVLKRDASLAKQWCSSLTWIAYKSS
ncbi:hypothetical protein JVU11DRAFT_996 [Chiua virens]|nr:hypothetical protein JVU11DRAFT_996 [Chiua virens]